MHSPNTNRAPADDTHAQATAAAIASPADASEASNEAADAQRSIEYWYFCGEGAALRIA